MMLWLFASGNESTSVLARPFPKGTVTLGFKCVLCQHFDDPLENLKYLAGKASQGFLSTMNLIMPPPPPQHISAQNTGDYLWHCGVFTGTLLCPTDCTKENTVEEKKQKMMA